MAIIVNDFTPSVSILGTDSIAGTDDKIRTIMDEVKDYLEVETQSAADQLDTEIDNDTTALENSIALKLDDSSKAVCTAWVVFDGTTTPPIIKDSYNIDDVERTATGMYDVYFTVDMDNTDYSHTSGAGYRVEALMSDGKYTNKISVTSGGGSGSSSVARTQIDDNSIHIFGGKN